MAAKEEPGASYGDDLSVFRLGADRWRTQSHWAKRVAIFRDNAYAGPWQNAWLRGSWRADADSLAGDHGHLDLTQLNAAAGTQAVGICENGASTRFTMTRLDSFIRRIRAQRACLNRAADLIKGVPGPVLELGLGNGRTYDHLRELMPERQIYAFDRQLAAHPDCIPPNS
jgi:hypothetical protein